MKELAIGLAGLFGVYVLYTIFAKQNASTVGTTLAIQKSVTPVVGATASLPPNPTAQDITALGNALSNIDLSGDDSDS